MPSIPARAFSRAFERTLAKGGRISDSDLAQLERSAAALKTRAEKAAAGDVLALVRHDKILDESEVAPARAALARLLGVTASRLPADLEQVLTHAVPVPNVRVAHYDLAFDFSHDDAAFPATAVITLEEAAPRTTILEVDPDRLAVSAVKVSGRPVAFVVKDGRLVVDAPGARALTVEYTVTPTDDVHGYGLIRDKYAGRMWTLTWPYNTGALFPSTSRPDDGATARVTVAVKAGQGVVAAGKQRSDGAFHLDGAVPAYAVAFTTGKFTDNGVTQQGEHEARTVGLGSSMSKALRAEVREHVAGSLDFFTRWLGPVAFGDRVNVVEIKSDYGGMEHAGAVAIGVGQTRRDTLEAAVHETAHHWFGDGVHIAHWGELWMSEGFTNYATFRYFRDRDGEDAFYGYLDAAKATLREQIDGEKKSAPLTEDRHVDPIDGLTWVPYMHGAWMLRMLEAQLGTPQIDALLSSWFTAQQGRSVTTQDFIDFAKTEHDLDLAPFFRAWKQLEKIPAVKDASKIDGSSVTLALTKKTPLPALPGGLSVPVVVKGRRGERATFQVTPGTPLKVDVGFKVKSIAWDPQRTLLIDVLPR
jgi:aminopeptidase N